MASFNKYQQFVADLAAGVHVLTTGTSHVLKVMLSNTAPDAAADAVRADAAEISAGNGYTAGGATIGTLTGAQTAGTFKLTSDTDPVFTASGSAMAPFRYAILYNDTPTSPADPLIGWWDYGSEVTLAPGDSFTVNLDGVSGILTVA